VVRPFDSTTIEGVQWLVTPLSGFRGQSSKRLRITNRDQHESLRCGPLLSISVSVHLGKIPDLNHDGSESDADGGESEELNDPDAEFGTEGVATEQES
jgi:hypothetical protein